MALAAALEFLHCPVCRSTLDMTGGQVRCAGGHSFDIARQGYLTLLDGSARRTIADDAAMIASRAEFLTAGHYGPIAAAIVRALGDTRAPCVLDMGTGTGYYLASVLDALPGSTGIGMDLSGYALRRAARAHPRAAAIGADLWREIPVRDGVVDLALSIFAPRNIAEIGRVLAPGGTLVIVFPHPEHLAEIRKSLHLIAVDPHKESRLARSLGPSMAPVSEQRVTYPMTLSAAELRALVGMGPSARHAAAGQLDAAVAALRVQQRVTVSVTVARYRRRPGQC